MHTLLRSGRALCVFLLCAATGLVTRPAQAQYKNSAFALDLGYGVISQPSLVKALSSSSQESAILQGSGRPNRLARLWRLGGEGDFKLHHDHWWFTGRVDLTFPNYGSPGDPAVTRSTDPDANADWLAAQNMGFILGTEAMLGIRYYILTDHVRPYMQLSVSYLHLFTFGTADTPCINGSSSAAAVCSTTGGTFGDSFLPHSNLLGAHVVPGIEFVIAKDLAIHVQADLQRWVIFSATGNNIVTVAAGLTFYS